MSKQIQKKKTIEEKEKKESEWTLYKIYNGEKKEQKIPPASHFLHGKTLGKDEPLRSSIAASVILHCIRVVWRQY